MPAAGADLTQSGTPFDVLEQMSQMFRELRRGLLALAM